MKASTVAARLRRVAWGAAWLGVAGLGACHAQPGPAVPIGSALSPTALSAAQPEVPGRALLPPPPAPASRPAAAASVPAGLPEHWKRLEVLPPDLSKAELIRTMKGFTQALDVKCVFCHAADNMAADTPTKNTARAMLRMTERINRDYFGGRRVVACATCHAGHEKPEAPETPSSMPAVFGQPVQ